MYIITKNKMCNIWTLLKRQNVKIVKKYDIKCVTR